MTDEAVRRYFGLRDSDSAPIDDMREFWWFTLDSERKLVVCAEPFTAENIEAGKIVSGAEMSRIIRKGTMVLAAIDPETGVGEVWYILSTAKEVRDESLAELYKECW